MVRRTRALLVTVTLAVPRTLTVADDGCGHDGSFRPGGQGPRNRPARAQVGGGTVHPETAPGGNCAGVMTVPP